MAKFKVGDVVEYKSRNEGLSGVANDGDWMVIRLAGVRNWNEYTYGVYHPSNTGNLYRESTLTKVEGVKWQDLPVVDRFEGTASIQASPSRFLRPYQHHDLKQRRRLSAQLRELFP